MCEGHRSVEDLLNATEDAPRFGLNARELILQAASRIAAQEDESKARKTKGSSQPGQKPSKQLLLFLYRKGPELLQGLSCEERPLVPFKAIQRAKVLLGWSACQAARERLTTVSEINPRPHPPEDWRKIPRITRQAVLDRLAGQHLALALHGAGASINAEQLLQLGDVRRAALQAAVGQEEGVYQRGRAAKSVYLNYAARENAADYLVAKNAELRPKSHGAEDEPPDPGEALEVKGMEAGVVTKGSEDSRGVQIEAAAETGESSVGSERPKKRKRTAAPAPLVEADIDWGSGGVISPEPHVANMPLCRGTALCPSDAVAGVGKPEEGGLKPGEEVKSEKAGGQSAQTRTLESPGGGLPDLREGRGLEEGAVRGSIKETARASSASGSGLHGWLEEVEGQPSAEGLMDYSPTRHGGESPPRRNPDRRAVQDLGSGRKPEAVGNPRVAGAVATFLRAHLDPLFQAKVIDRSTFKAAMQKTVEKVMACHQEATDARFLIKDGHKITKLLMQYVKKLTA